MHQKSVVWVKCLVNCINLFNCTTTTLQCNVSIFETAIFIINEIAHKILHEATLNIIVSKAPRYVLMFIVVFKEYMESTRQGQIWDASWWIQLKPLLLEYYGTFSRINIICAKLWLVCISLHKWNIVTESSYYFQLNN